MAVTIPSNIIHVRGKPNMSKVSDILILLLNIIQNNKILSKGIS